MSFLTLNGTVVRVKSDALQQKYNEHRLDRERMFDGTMRMTRAGVFRQWDVTTHLMDDSDANTLLALVNGGGVLTAGGDVVGDDIAVMPVPGGNNPVHVGGGIFKRQVTFTLHETGGPLPADMSAVPFLFLRAGTRLFSDNDGTVAAGDGDAIGYWKDATGLLRGVTRYFSDDFKPHLDGSVVHFDETGSSTFGSVLVFDTATQSDWNALTSGEIMAAVKADAHPPAADTKGVLWWLGAETGGAPTSYAKTDSHIYGGFGVGVGGIPYDLGDQGDLSSAYRVFGESSDGTQYIARLDNTVIRTVTVASDSHTCLFDTLAPAIGHSNPGINDHWLGRIKHLVIFAGVLTPSQRRSWYDFLRGAVVDPPIASLIGSGGSSGGTGGSLGGVPDGSEPVFDSGTDTLIFAEDFTGFTSAHQMWLDRANSGTRFGQTDATGDPTLDEDVAGIDIVSPGRDGVTGKAVKFTYTGTYQESHELWCRNMSTVTDRTGNVYQYWAKVEIDTPLGVSAEWPIKWFMNFHRTDGIDTGLRVQWNTHDYLPGPLPPSGQGAGSMWVVTDRAESTTQQPVGPYATNFVNSGTWARFSHRYLPNSAPGARDCVVQMWINGVLIVNIQASAVGVTPAGGWKPWCTNADLDAIGSTAVNFIKVMGNLTADTPGFRVFWTEFQWWTEP